MRIPAVLATVALAAIAVFGFAGPASAHDQLLSTNPADGSTVAALPAEVTLTFSDSVIDAGSDANQVKVMDASCKELDSGPVQIQDNVVTQALKGPATGRVTVLWRVVSRDGHPVSDEFSFTVSGSGAVAASPSSSCAPQAGATTPSATSNDAMLPWIIGGGVVVIVAAVIVLLVTRSRRAGDR